MNKILERFAERPWWSCWEAAGKSTVWAQMNLPFEGRKRRVVNFLHAEGVDSSKLEFLGDEECYREYY